MNFLLLYPEIILQNMVWYIKIRHYILFYCHAEKSGKRMIVGTKRKVGMMYRGVEVLPQIVKYGHESRVTWNQE
jgi:hypothetical protein